MKTLVTSQYQPRLSSITKIFSRRISQSDRNIQIKFNYFTIIKIRFKFRFFCSTFVLDFVNLIFFPDVDDFSCGCFYFSFHVFFLLIVCFYIFYSVLKMNLHCCSAVLQCLSNETGNNFVH